MLPILYFFEKEKNLPFLRILPVKFTKADENVF